MCAFNITISQTWIVNILQIHSHTDTHTRHSSRCVAHIRMESVGILKCACKSSGLTIYIGRIATLFHPCLYMIVYHHIHIQYRYTLYKYIVPVYIVIPHRNLHTYIHTYIRIRLIWCVDVNAFIVRHISIERTYRCF